MLSRFQYNPSTKNKLIYSDNIHTCHFCQFLTGDFVARLEIDREDYNLEEGAQRLSDLSTRVSRHSLAFSEKRKQKIRLLFLSYMSLTSFTLRALTYVEKETSADEVFNSHCVRVADDFISALVDLSFTVNMSCG